MTHTIRSLETHLKNTWQFDAWGFTRNWADKCTLSDIDGFYAFMGERNNQFLIIEMKHWDGIGDVPKMNLKSGQARALMALAKLPQFIVIIGYGDTATRAVHYHEIWDGSIRPVFGSFTDTLTRWWNYANTK